MKKNYLLFPILSVLLYMTACSDNDGAIMNPSFVNMYGRVYNLAGGVIWENAPNKIPTKERYVFLDRYTDGNGQQATDSIIGYTFGEKTEISGNYILTLYESGMSFDKNLKSYVGSGACVCFHLTSEDKDMLKMGKYTNAFGKEPFTFLAYTSNDFASYRGYNPSATVKEGEMEISKEGEEYILNFDLTNNNNGRISGSYTGKLDIEKLHRNNILNIKDIKIDGLMDSIVWEYYQDGICYKRNSTLDTRNGKSCYSTFNSQSRYPQFCTPEQIDICLKWDADNRYVYFETPIKMVSYLGHDPKYIFPCHTIYMNAPADFTDEDYENLQEVDLNIEMKSEKVTVNESTIGNRYVFFKTGNGLMGVMKLRRYNEPTRGTWEHKPSGQGNSWDVNPFITLDMKCQTSYSDKRIS